MSFKIEVQGVGETAWVSNAIRLATKLEADLYGRDLAYRWTGLGDWRIAESDDPVNYRWEDGLREARP